MYIALDFKLVLFDNPVDPSSSSEHSTKKGTTSASAINITKKGSRQHISDVLKDFDAVTVTEKTTQSSDKKNEGTVQRTL